MKAPAKKVVKGKKAAAKAPAKAAAAKQAATPAVVKKAAMAKKAVAKKAVAKKQAATTPMQLLPAAATPLPGVQAAVLDRLFDVITARRSADVTRSHSARLLSRGMEKVAQKFGEEAVECLIEAVTGNTEALVAESADVLYHLLVMWVAAGVEPDQVWTELARREGVSGIDEKAARPRPIGTTKIP